MEIKLTTINKKKFFHISIISIPIILFLSFGLAFLVDNSWFAFLLIPLLIVSIYIAQGLSNSETIIDLGEADYFKINNEEIAYKSVIGYFANEGGLTQTELYIKLDANQSIQIASSTSGEKGEAFNKALDEILKALKRKNEHIQELTYQDVYVRQLNYLRPIIYASIITLLILDAIIIFLFVTGKTKLPGQIFYANFLLLLVIPLLKKKKE